MFSIKVLGMVCYEGGCVWRGGWGGGEGGEVELDTKESYHSKVI